MRHKELTRRQDAPMPFQEWNAFPPDAIVLAKNKYGERRIELAGNLYWGYWEELGEVADGVIMSARRLDYPKTTTPL